MPLLVHGILGAADAARLDATTMTERRATTVTVVSEGALAALVSDVEDEEVLPTRALLLGHASLLEEVAATSTVLPLRFGTVVDSATTLRHEVLGPRQEPLQHELDRLRGCVELRVRGRYDPEQVLRSVLATDSAARRLHGRPDVGSRIALGERMLEGVERQRARDLEFVREQVGRRAQDVATDEVRDPMDAFALSLLVHERDRDAVERDVDELADVVTPRIAIKLVGPIPPYSFVSGPEPAWVS